MKYNVYRSIGTAHDEYSEFVKSFDDEDEAWDYVDTLNQKDYVTCYFVEER